MGSTCMARRQKVQLSRLETYENDVRTIAPRNQKYKDQDANAPAVNGLDFGGGKKLWDAKRLAENQRKECPVGR